MACEITRTSSSLSMLGLETPFDSGSAAWSSAGITPSIRSEMLLLVELVTPLPLALMDMGVEDMPLWDGSAWTGSSSSDAVGETRDDPEPPEAIPEMEGLIYKYRDAALWRR